ncbi:hypothetical protein QR680_008018 [Steinernema hermaphroditum]|uniref:7TM GPCR serpentine receptor class x (Srx) domain-containing protein n=1 Tax=Steinernema hermaphroditum TaxID=289476 RepID=A0AA39IHF0_9BILA|nr:hypothetical protein QR680_008018 [Steinernema hermaphroditum]
MNSALSYGFEIQGRGEATKEDIYIGVSMFILALCTIVLGSVNLYFIKKVSIFHNAFGWLWASRTVAEMIVEVNHALYTAPVTIIQPRNVDPSVAYILYFVTFIGAVSGCLLHGLLSVNRCIAVYFPVHYRRIFTKSFCFGYIAAIGVSCLALASIYIGRSLLQATKIHSISVFPCNMIGYSPTVRKVGPEDKLLSRNTRFFAQSAFQNVYMLFTAAVIVYANNKYEPERKIANLLGFFSLLGTHIVNAMALLLFNAEVRKRILGRNVVHNSASYITKWHSRQQ